MKKPDQLTKFIGGVLGSMTLGIALFMMFLTYGGRNGCWEPVNTFFGTRGYESCGLFGFFLGILIGSMAGVMLAAKIKQTYQKQFIFWATIVIIAGPTALGIVMEHSLGVIKAAFLIGAITLALSIVPTTIFLSIYNGVQKRKEKQDG